MDSEEVKLLKAIIARQRERLAWIDKQIALGGKFYDPILKRWVEKARTS